MPSFLVQTIHRNHWHPSHVKSQWHRAEIKETHAQGCELLKWCIQQCVAVLSHRSRRLCQQGATTSCPCSLQWGHMETLDILTGKSGNIKVLAHLHCLYARDSGHFEGGGWFIYTVQNLMAVKSPSSRTNVYWFWYLAFSLGRDHKAEQIICCVSKKWQQLDLQPCFSNMTHVVINLCTHMHPVGVDGNWWINHHLWFIINTVR